jgi:hypothetical protein
MRAMIFSPIAAVVVCLGAADVASAQPVSAWVGEGRTFRQENGGWAEYYKGQKAFTFVNSGSGPGWIGLYDDTRGIRVELSSTQAVVSRGGKVLFAYKGMWRWQEFTRSDKKGSFVHTGDGKWSEFFDGKVIFTFQETGRARDEVILFDQTRGIEVKLTSKQAIVTAGNRTLLTYNGRFTR